MKWIKLFEAFTGDDKIKSINILLSKFLIMRYLNQLDLKKIETSSFIYFYEISAEEKLLFVFDKIKNRILYTNSVINGYLGILRSYNIPLLGSRTHFNECLRLFFTKHIAGDFKVKYMLMSDWKNYEKNFVKLMIEWIKLFESFDNLEKKINFINDAYCYFKIMLEFKQMNLQKVRNFGSIENIGESFKNIPIIAGLAAGLALGSPEVGAVEKPRTESKYLNPWSEKIEMAKRNVIAKVFRNKNIINKDSVADKIKNVSIEVYKTKQSSTLMYYYYDKKKKKDVVMVNLAKIDSSSVYQTMVHELNHLVDQHKITSEQDVVVTKDISRLEFAKYFDDWRKIEKKGKKYSVTDLWSYAYSRDKSYFTSEHEVEARLSSLYQFMVDNSILESGEKFQSKHIDKMKEWIEFNFPRGKGEEVERAYQNFLRNDFIPILPLLDWNKEEGINMIVKNDNSEQSIA